MNAEAHGLLANGVQALIDTPSTTTIALGSIMSPLWLPRIADVSAFAATLMPILGVAWLIIQIISKIHEMRKGK